jgi:hypothetical protein
LVTSYLVKSSATLRCKKTILDRTRWASLNEHVMPDHLYGMLSASVRDQAPRQVAAAAHFEKERFQW